MGHYALPLLHGDQAVGWANAALVDKARLEAHVGFADRSVARDPGLAAAIDDELGRMATFLELDSGAAVRLKRARK